MNESANVTYTCPYCGRGFEIEVWPVIYGDGDEDLRDRCLSGDLFRHSCPHCKHEFMVQNDLVYIDRIHKFVIWVSEKDPGSDLIRFTGPLKDAGYVLRRCPTLQEFSMKIQVLEDEVDDRMVELARYDSFIEFVNNKKGTPEEVTSVEYQRTENGVMKINVRTDDKGMSFLIPVSMLEEEMEENASVYEIDNESFPVINDAWIISLFTDSMGEA